MSKPGYTYCPPRDESTNLGPLFPQIRLLGLSATTTEERAIRNRVIAAERRLLGGTNTPPDKVKLSRSAAERGEEDIAGDWGGERLLSNHQSTGGTTGSRWQLQEGLGRPVGECSAVRQYYRGPTCSNERANERGARQRRRMPTPWRSVTLAAEGVGKQGKVGQHARGGTAKDTAGRSAARRWIATR